MDASEPLEKDEKKESTAAGLSGITVPIGGISGEKYVLRSPA